MDCATSLKLLLSIDVTEMHSLTVKIWKMGTLPSVIWLFPVLNALVLFLPSLDLDTTLGKCMGRWNLLVLGTLTSSLMR